MSQTACSVRLAYNQGIGMTLLTVAGFLSLSFVLVALVYIIIRAPGKGFNIIRKELDLFVLSLLIGDLIQALGCTINVKWIQDRLVVCSDLCTIQGGLNIIGATTSSMSVLAIAVYTFCTIGLRWRFKSMIIPYIIVFFIWLYAILFTAVAFGLHNSAPDDQLIVPIPWCFIGNRFQAERITGEYLWLWLAAGGSILLYLPLPFIIRRNTYRDSLPPVYGSTPVPRVHCSSVLPLLYPTVFIILVLPMSVARWLQFSHKYVPTAAIYAGISIFYLTGFFDVILFLYMRRSGVTLLDSAEEYSVDDEKGFKRMTSPTGGLPD